MPLADTGAATRFCVVAPPIGLKLDAVGRAVSQSYTVTNPSAAVFVAVTLSNTLFTPAGTPAAPPTPTVTTAPAAGRVPV